VQGKVDPQNYKLALKLLAEDNNLRYANNEHREKIKRTLQKRNFTSNTNPTFVGGGLGTCKEFLLPKIEMLCRDKDIMNTLRGGENENELEPRK